MSKLEYRTETLINFWSLREEARKKEETQSKECPYHKKHPEKDISRPHARKAA